MYEDEIANLSMTDEKWEHLMDCLPESEYNRISQDYIKRKNSLSHCSAKWGICQNYRDSHCMYSGDCKYKA